MSENTFHDGNHIQTFLCVQDNGSSLINIRANPSNHGIKVADGTGGTDAGPYNSLHDSNHKPILMAVSSRTATVNGKNYIQGVTRVAVYGDSSGNLLIQAV